MCTLSHLLLSQCLVTVLRLAPGPAAVHSLPIPEAVAAEVAPSNLSVSRQQCSKRGFELWVKAHRAFVNEEVTRNYPGLTGANRRKERRKRFSAESWRLWEGEPNQVKDVWRERGRAELLRIANAHIAQDAFLFYFSFILFLFFYRTTEH